MRRDQVPLCLCALALATSCGGVDGNDPPAESPPPVTLHALDDTPGCYAEPDLSELQGALWDMAKQQRTINAMYASFEIQSAELLLTPVREHPEAERWDAQKDRLLIEGRSLARGDGWGVLVVAGTVVDEGEIRFYRDLELRYTPRATLVRFDDGASVLQASEDFYQANALLRGCDAEEQIHFEVGPGVVDDALVDDVLLCWGQGIAPPPTQADAVDQWRLGEGMRCLHAVDRVLDGRLFMPGERRLIPVVVP